MRLYSYVLKHDRGFAPNPFFGYCTLACCKPAIRRTAKKGDWIVGLTPKADGNRVAYFMRVDEEPLAFDAYWREARFRPKRPRFDAGTVRECGDNIYRPKSKRGYDQLRSMHRDGNCENRGNKKRDLSGKHVLVSETFAYLGSEARELPPELKSLVVLRGHRCNSSDKLAADFLRFAENVGFGVQAAPRKWPHGDDSWVKASGGRKFVK
jgi:hypothetical protein